MLYVPLLVLVASAASAIGEQEAQRLDFSTIRALRFFPDRETTYRRTERRPQISCVDGLCPSGLPPVTCRRDGNEWECQDAEKAFAFDEVIVVCEGYTGADDRYILRGSCGLTVSVTEVETLTGQGSLIALLATLAIGFVLVYRHPW